MILPLLSVLVLVSPPPARERFPPESLSHVLLVVDAATGRVVRADDPDAAEGRAFPAGEAIRPVLALTALETGVADPEDTVECDARCWAQGGHGTPALLDALAFSCDSWFREVEARLPPRALADRAEALGFGVSADSAPSTWSVTARAWVELWSGLAAGSLGRRAVSAPTLLAAAGLAVSSPRGAAHTLYDPTVRARALGGDSDEGAWVCGSYRADERHSWIFALFLRRGSLQLAVARAGSLLDETLRVYRTSTAERGGVPLPRLDDR